MAALSQGTVFSFAGTTYTCTRVSVNLQWTGNTRNKISAATLSSNINAEEPFEYGFLPYSDDTPSTVDVDFLGGGGPGIGTNGTLTVSGGASFTTTSATCASSTITAQVGDLLRGSASFKVKV
jgi:hypothetical protein